MINGRVAERWSCTTFSAIISSLATYRSVCALSGNLRMLVGCFAAFIDLVILLWCLQTVYVAVLY